MAGSVSVVVSACSSSNDAALAALAEGCTVNSDCNDPLVCAFKECHDKCDSSRDCPDGELCIASDKPYHVCQLPNETKCTTNSQCATGEICGIDDKCRDACSSDRDCLPTQYCAGGTCADIGDPPVAAVDASTAATPGTPCQYTSDCTEPLVCESGLCAFQCVTDRDCAQGLSCLGHLCSADAGMSIAPPDASVDGSDDASPVDATMINVDAGPIDSGDNYRIPDGAPAGYGNDCALASDCPTGLVCTNARCVYQCVDAFDCNTGAGQCCSSFHVCVSGSACSVTVTDAAVDSGSGASCADDQDCQDGNLCDGYERCTNGKCANSKAACDDSDPCTVDTCNEMAGTCTHAASAPVDQDGDGHYAIACGNGADDCDDTSSNVYPGHPEICDFVDNNCNGMIDEGVWSSGTPVAAPNGLAGSFANAPGITTLSDGSFIIVGQDNSISGSDTAYWHLAATTKTIDNGTGITPASAQMSNFGALASNGTTVFSSLIENNGEYAAMYAFTPGGTVTQVSSQSEGEAYSISYGAVLWQAALARYLIVYSDPHLVGTSSPFSQIFANSASATGALGGAHQVFSGSDGQVPTGTPYSDVTYTSNGATTRLSLAENGTNALLAWTSYGTGHTRYALLSSDLTSIQEGPFDLTGTDEVIAASAAAVTGGAYILATSDAASTMDRLVLIDGVTGAASTTVPIVATNPTYRTDIHVAPQGPGLAITLNSGGGLQFGYASATLSGSPSFAILPVSASTGANMAPVDSKHTVLTWGTTSSALQAALLTCGM